MENLRHDELFEDLRLHGVKHLGQIESAYIEASGQLSIYFLPDEKVEYGLPVIPELFESAGGGNKGTGYLFLQSLREYKRDRAELEITLVRYVKIRSG